VTPAALRRLTAPDAAATPPLATVSRRPVGAPGRPLAAPDGEASRVAAAAELLPPPYAQRLEASLSLPASGAAAEGGDAAAALAAPVAAAAVPGSASAAAADAEGGDGMEHLGQRAAGLRFGRDLRLAEVRRLLRSSAPVPLRLAGVPEAADAGGWGRCGRAAWSACSTLSLHALHAAAAWQQLPGPRSQPASRSCGTAPPVV
jgi:hypothetical protein